MSQDRIVLTRFDYYWNKDAYHFDKIIYLPIPDASVRLANLRAGDLDLTEGIAASDVKTVEADSKLALAKVTGLGYQGITFNINNGKVPANDPFKGRSVREAFLQAIDRDALNQVVFEGLYTPANQAFSTVKSVSHVNLPVPPRDVDKAKALLKAAGVTAPLTVNLLVPNNPTSQQVGQVLQAMVAEAGFNLNADDRIRHAAGPPAERRLSAELLRLVGAPGSGRQHLRLYQQQRHPERRPLQQRAG